MTIDRNFGVALLFSLGIHVAVLSPLPGFVSHPHKVPDTEIEVTYIKMEEEKMLEAELAPAELIKASLEEKLPAPEERKDPPQSKEKKIEPRRTVEEKKASPASEIKKIFAADGVLDLNSLSAHKGSSDSINYLKTIRDRISRFVHRRYSTVMGEGEALLHFVLSPDGSVRSATMLRDNLSGNERLKNLCLDSIYHSSPFRPFPSELDLDQAAFKINISFKRD